MRALDGTYMVAWLSDRDEPGNDDIYLTRSADGRTWDPPLRTTFHPDSDWYPSLVQTSNGVFHLSWFRAQGAPPYARHTFMLSSNDGVTWNSSADVAVTSGLVDDWCPSMVADANGDLRIYFSSQIRGTSGNMDLYVTKSVNQGATWSQPAALTSANDDGQVDMFPFVISRSVSDFAMVWVRYDAAATTNYFHSSTDLFYAQSTDGEVWTNVAPITADDAAGYVDSIPTLVQIQGGATWDVAWTSTGPAGPAMPRILTMPLAERNTYPAFAVDRTAGAGMNGYSVHMTPATAGLYLAVFVHDDQGAKRTFWQLFAR